MVGFIQMLMCSKIHAHFVCLALAALLLPTPLCRADTVTLFNFESGLQGWVADPGATRPVNVSVSSIGVTGGTQALALRQTGDGSSGSFFLARVLNSGADLFYNSFNQVALNRGLGALEFDVTIRDIDIPPANQFSVIVSISSDAGFKSVGGLAVGTGDADQTVHVSIPFSDFGANPLATNSSYYDMGFGLDGDWGSGNATVYIDNIRVALPPSEFHGLLREVYTGIPGGLVSDLTNAPSFPNAPTGVFLLTNLFEAPQGQGTNYGQRLSGYIIPPVSGSYIFWTSSDDRSTLFLSTDDQPANKRMIASVLGWTNSREWTKETNQQSAPITLVAGSAYYIEVLMKQGAGGDNLAVGWQLPDTTFERPIPASRLYPSVAHGILREFYSGIVGATVANLTNAPAYPNSPTTSTILPNLFESPLNQGDNYGLRLRGYLVAPGTGNYTFWISSDDNSALFLSTDDKPANRQSIASVLGWTNSREWTKETNQQSAPIALVAGSTYYFEALMKEGGGGDNLAVGWQLPDNSLERPIPAARIYPFAVAPLGQSISFIAPGDRTTADPPIVLNAKADSGLPVIFTSLTPGVVTVDGNLATIVGPGPAVIRASQAGGTPYLPAVEIERIFNVKTHVTAQFGLLREVFHGIPGGNVADLTNAPVFPNAPDSTSFLTDAFETRFRMGGDNYGQRIRGYVVPPATGNYTFWISSDDASELYLSTDAQPANKVLIAAETTWNSFRNWTNSPSQQSPPVALVAGVNYYVEALMKQGGGGEHLSVGWKLPDNSLERPIPASRLRPYDAANPPLGRADLSVSQSFSPASAKVGNNLSFTLVVANAGPSPAHAVVLTNTLSTNANLVTVQSSQGTIGGSANQLVFDLGTLPAGATVTVNLLVVPTSPGTVTNGLVVVAAELDSNPANNSSLATVPVPGPPVINTQPQGTTLQPGNPIALSVSVGGTGPFQFQWRLNGLNLPSQTGPTLNVASAQFKDGGAYSVVVSSPGGVTISSPALIQFGLANTPGGDLFAARASLPDNSGALRGNNATATSEANEPRHAGKPGGKSVWYTWQPGQSGVATLSTAGSTFDTLLAVYQGTAVNSLTLIASDDDSGGTGTSLLQFNAVAGQIYQIVIDGHGGESGDYLLTWSLVVAPALPEIIEQPVGLTRPNGGNGALAVVATGPNLTFQWFKDGAPVNSATAYTLNLASFSVSDVGHYFVRISTGLQTVDSVTVSVEMGTDPNAQSQDKFEDLFGGAAGPGGSGLPHRSGFTSVAAGTLGTQVFSSVGSGTQSGEPATGGASGGASRWFYLKPTSAGVMIIDTIGSTFDTIMTVYTGPSLFSLSPVTSDDNSAPDGIRSRVRFDAVAGQQYYVVVDGVGGATGTVYLNYGLGTAPVITVSPQSSTNLTGASVTLTSAAMGLAAPTYQWRKNGINLAGAVGATLPLGPVTSAQAGTYTLVASNFLGGAVSQPGIVTVATRRSFANGLGAPDAGLVLTNGALRLTLTGGGYGALVIDVSTNLVNWTPLLTNPVSSSDFLYFAPASNSPARYYRAREVR